MQLVVITAEGVIIYFYFYFLSCGRRFQYLEEPRVHFRGNMKAIPRL